MDQINRIAELNNLLMKIKVSGDDVFRLAAAMDICLELYNNMEKGNDAGE